MLNMGIARKVTRKRISLSYRRKQILGNRHRHAESNPELFTNDPRISLRVAAVAQNRFFLQQEVML